MLEEALAVAYRRSQAEQEKVAVATLLDQLPIEVLREIAETGEIKLAFGMCGPDGSSNGWLDQFKGTPFFQQAIALEQEDLQTQTANQQANSVENQKSQQRYAASDQVRLKKKLLELQKAQNEAQVLNSSQGPADMTGSNTPPPTASPTLPAETTGGGQGGEPKMAGLRRVQRIAESGLKKLHGPSDGLMDAGQRAGLKLQRRAGNAPGGSGAWVTHHGLDPNNPPPGATSLSEALGHASPPGVGMPKSAEVVDDWAREMARNDMGKVAHAKGAFSVADAAGRMMAKTALAGSVAGGGAANALIKHLTRHPEHALAAAGGLAGAAHGLMKQDGGITDAIGEGVAGAGAGYTAGAMGKHLLAGHGLAQSAQRSIAGAHSDIKNVARASGDVADNAIKALKPDAPKVRVAEDVA